MTDTRTVPLLDADPDLGRLLSGEEFELGRRKLIVRRHFVEPGSWEGERLREAGPEHVGLLLLGGLMTRELVLADNVSSELLGPGDLVRPWQAAGPERLVPYEIRWTALERTEMAVLDRHFAAALTQYPQVNAMLIDRLTERFHRMSLMQAISQLNGVDRRLLTLFWHLAERWGRVGREGIVVPLEVPHRVLAQLVGARRPTVSSALRQLAERGELVRERDGTWLLTGAPFGLPTEEAGRIVRLRRFRREELATSDGELEALPRTGRIAELADELAELRTTTERHRGDMEELRTQTRDLLERLRIAREERTNSGSGD